MEFREFSGKTVEEAITEATVQMGVSSSEIYYEISDKGSTGLFGIGAKDATINVCLKSEKEAEDAKLAKEAAKEEKKAEKAEQKEEKKEIKEEEKSSKKEEREVDPQAADEATKFLNEVFEAMKLDVEITCSVNDEDKTLDIDLVGPEMGVIIGKRGQTLDSLQYLTNLAVNRKVESYTRVKIDTEDYRRRRKETLENLAKNMAYKAKRNRKPVSLEPMNPYERRVIHAALQDDDRVDTHSEGEEPYRHVVITCK